MKQTSNSNYLKQVYQARSIFLTYDQEMIVQKYQLKKDAAYLYLTYLSRPHRIHRKTGAVEYRPSCCDTFIECTDFQSVMTIYDMLCYSKTKKIPELSGIWQPLANFAAAGASPSSDLISGAYLNQWHSHTEVLRSSCLKAGGIMQPALAGADITCLFYCFPFFPVLFQYWEEDEEFPAKIMILWDQNSLSFLHYETLYYLMGDLLSQIADSKN